MEGDEIVGIIDESDVLMKVFENAEAFEDTVDTAMTSNLEFLSIKTPLDQLMPIFDEGKVAIVKENDQFLGLITRIDLLNYLRRVDINQ
ncbi:MAG: CBS domain-containing protein, partial [Marinicella sp.]